MSPTQYPTSETLLPTFSPSGAPTFVSPMRICNYTAIEECDFSLIKSSYCCNSISAHNLYAKEPNLDQAGLTQEEMLSTITLIKDIATSMIVIDVITLFLATILACILAKKYKKTFEESLQYIIYISVVGALVDICLTFSCIYIISQNGLIDEVGKLFTFGCFSMYSTE
eukprot:410203_1